MQKFAPDAAKCEQERPGVFKQMPVTPLQLTPPQLTTVAACPNLQNIINSHPSPSKPPKYPVLSPSPNQVTRLDKMTSSSLNNDYQMKLAGTQGLEVFTNYELINTQWPLNGRRKLIGEQYPFATTINMKPCPSTKVDPSCYTNAPLGLRLRNTTLETYQVSYHMPNVKAGPFFNLEQEDDALLLAADAKADAGGTHLHVGAFPAGDGYTLPTTAGDNELKLEIEKHRMAIGLVVQFLGALGLGE